MSLTSLLPGETSPSQQAYPSHRSAQPVLQSLRAEGTVHGLLLEMRVEQAYVNPGSTNIEAVYTFPLPVDAVLLELEFELGERRLQGKVVASGDAEEGYETALENGHSAVLLERAADGVYTVNVGNLLGKEKAVVRIRYARLLSFQGGQVRITIPNVIAPRYGDPSAARLRMHQIPVHDLGSRHPFSVAIRLAGPVARGRISSPSHSLAVRHAGEHVEISLAQPDSASLDRDFVLLSDGLQGKSIATAGHDGDGLVALASFCPAPVAERKHWPLHLKILVDCSGSMNGDSIKGARKALHEILKQLNPSDRFSYSRFGSKVTHYSDTLMAASARAINEAGGWIAETAADMGNTEIRQALISTVMLGQAGEADILLITDGHVWDTDSLVASALKAGQRIFAVGVGAAPAASLLQRLAKDTGGACELVGAKDDVHAAILRTFGRMRQAPVRDVAVTWNASCEWQSDAGKVVFSGDTVHAFSGFAGALPDTASVAWTEGCGTVRQEAMQLDGQLVEGDTLARVAAAFRIGASPAKEGHALALRYGLMTATTSMLVVDERVDMERACTPPILRVVPQMHAAGHGGIGGLRVAQSPTIWRRETASEQMQAMMRNGVETYEKPAFLRGQEHASRYLYRGQLRQFLQLQDAVLRGGKGPLNFAEVEDLLPDSVLRQLQDIAEQGHTPDEVLRQFILALHSCFHRRFLPLRLFDRIRRRDRAGTPMDPLHQRVSLVAAEAYNAAYPRVEDIPAFLRKRAD